MRGSRYVPLLALAGTLGCAAFAAHAQQNAGPLASLSGDAIFGVIGAVAMAALGGYSRALSGRIRDVEIQQRQVETQVNLFRATMMERHPTRSDMDQMREDMRQKFDDLKDFIKEYRP